MSDAAAHHKELEVLASRILEVLSRPGTGRDGRTAWELKMELKSAHTALFTALGMLVERGAVRLAPHELTVLVSPAGATAPKTPSEITA